MNAQQFTEALRSAALAAIKAGCAPIPNRPGGKAPIDKWAADMAGPMDTAEVPQRFRNGANIGIVCGAASGNLECLDFDAAELWQPFLDTLESVSQDLHSRLTVWQQTPSGGNHLLYRVSGEVGGSKDLAKTATGEVAIETRGTGGQFVIAPSRAVRGHGKDTDGKPHPYTLHGDLAHLPTITVAERDLLHRIAKSFDEAGTQEQEHRHQGGTRANGATGDRPGDRFNRETDWNELLVCYGWHYLKTTGDRQHWQRPGKTGPEASGTLHQERGFWSFSTSTPLPTEKPLTKFAVFTYYEHSGDFKAAARALAARYGTGGQERHDHTGQAAHQNHQGEAGLEEWLAPIPLDQPDLPTFDASDFPFTLWGMTEAIARSTETPAELAAMNVLAVAAAAVQRKLTIELVTGYVEPLPLWTATQLPPGSRKSAAQKPAIRPLLQWEIEQAQTLEPTIRAARATRAAEEGRLKELQRKFGKEQDESKREALREEIETAEAGLTEVPRPPRIIGQDITPEHLATLMSDHGERLALFSSEGGVFSIMAGRYSGGVANLDIYLQSHSGDAIRVDRGSRPNVYLREPALTMGLSVQPDVLQDMASKPGFRGRGLVGRFLYVVPPDIVGRRRLQTTPIARAVSASYGEMITALLNMGEQRNPLSGELFAIQLTNEAHSAWQEFALWVEGAMAEGGEMEHMRDWAGKLPGAAGRIAGVFHCCEHAGRLLQDEMDTPERYSLSGATMQTALNLARKLVPHAIHTYAFMGEGGDTQAARRVLRWIEGTGADEFTVRDCYQAMKGTFPRRADLDPGLAVLIERGYIRRPQTPEERKPGRPSERLQVNPAIRRR